MSKPIIQIKKTLGEVVSCFGLKQLRVAETEKYAHVTFFFNGGRETEFEGEERILVPSPKVATYDLKPEMSAFEVSVTSLGGLIVDFYWMHLLVLILALLLTSKKIKKGFGYEGI